MDLHSPRVHERELRGISLCAGYGGLDLGLHIAEPGYRTVAYVEREAHAAATLVARMADSSLGQAPIWDDLRSFDGRPWRGRLHILTAGYPCQPFSHAGKRRGSDDPRHLWPEVARIIGECGPEWVFCENVEGHIDLGLTDVASCLRELGYTPKAGLFTAREAGASHRRRRIFILAHANSIRCGLLPGSDSQCRTTSDGVAARHSGEQLWPIFREQRCPDLDAAVDHHPSIGPDTRPGEIPLFAPGPGDLRAWAGILGHRDDLQPAILRTSDGMADRVERTRGAGNGVCSMAAAIAWRTLRAAHAADAVNALTT